MSKKKHKLSGVPTAYEETQKNLTKQRSYKD